MAFQTRNHVLRSLPIFVMNGSWPEQALHNDGNHELPAEGPKLIINYLHPTPTHSLVGHAQSMTMCLDERTFNIVL